jgi:hypothetical protein
MTPIGEETMPTEELLIDDLVDEPEDPFTIIPEIKRELAQAHSDDELGLRTLLERPEWALPQRLSRISPAALYRMYDWNSAADDEVSSAA